MITKVEAFATENNMFTKGESILIALSGGPDSVCLTHILVNLREKYGFKLYAAHVNHMLRGNEADYDEQYVRELCDRYNIELFVKRVDINKIVKEEGLSSELAGRRERYDFFDELCNEHYISRIAIAHNENDQAETILMRIIRGSGIEGVAGIRPVREERYIRPILCLSRDEIESYCNENNLKPRIDKTNMETIYSRNKIRLELLPYIKKNFNEDIINTINRFGKMCAVDSDFIHRAAHDVFVQNFTEADNYGVLSSNMFSSHESIVSRCVKLALEYVSGVKRNFEMKHIYSIINLQRGETGKSIQLPNDITAINVYGDIKILKNSINISEYAKPDEKIISIKDILKFDENQGMNFDFYKYSINMRIIKDKNVDFKSNHLIKYFDCDNINTVKLRFRKNGDKIVPMGMKSPKKIKDIFINEKVPKDQRDNIPILQFDDYIAWVVGVKCSDVFKITGSTKNILQVKMQERV